MVENGIRLFNRLAIRSVEISRPEPKYVVVRRIKDDPDFIALTTSRRVKILAGNVNRQDQIRECNALFLHRFQGAHAQTLGRKLKDRLH